MARRRYLHVAAFILWVAVVGLAARFALAAVAIKHDPKTLDDLRARAALASKPASEPEHRKIRILIVPGHEPKYGGAAFGKIKERDLTVDFAKDLQSFLDADGRYETVLSRDALGWNPSIAQYFKTQWNEIDAWRKQARAEMTALISSGAVKKPVVHVGHNDAPNDVAVRLYGITKWANENDIDLMLHVHFDDDRASTRAAGRRTGFAVFVPSPEYFNGAPTRAVAEKVLARLSAFDPVSDLPGVKGGIVDDPELIAVGQQNTSDAASMLIEYAFIYERQLQTPAVRAMALDDMAYQTFLGLGDFFFNGLPASSRKFVTTVLPYVWKKPIRDASADPADVFAMQTALIADGDYPPPSKINNDCPRTGLFGDCTRAALKRFQQKYGIAGESGVAGPKTIAQLNALFSK